MAIFHNPKPGALLQCDFTMNANPRDPEMDKARPVVVLARPRNGLCIVVSLSCSESVPIRPWHREMDYSGWPEHLHNRCWAKCDMISTVADWRLDRYFQKDQYGKRKYLPYCATEVDFAAIKLAVNAALGF